MKYTVTWCESASNHLADLYEGASDKKALTDASNRIDRELKNDPDRKARRFGEFFIYESVPLMVLLKISPDDCLVEVVKVGLSN